MLRKRIETDNSRFGNDCTAFGRPADPYRVDILRGEAASLELRPWLRALDRSSL